MSTAANLRTETVWAEAPGVFVTGTDTECGKTEVSLGLMRLLQQCGLSVLGMKPVASGAEPTPEGLRNRDALLLWRQGSFEVPYDQVNPWVFEAPIAPHLAAERQGVAIELEIVRAAWNGLAGLADRVLVEGVGGWRVPLGAGWSVSDLPRELGLPVVLVVGLRLGCINHALLSAESILGSGVPLAGWVANCVDPAMLAPEENLACLRRLMPAPLLGRVPYLPVPTPESVAAALDRNT